MKRITLVLLMLFTANQVFGVASKTIEKYRITYHNYSGGNYDVSNHKISIDNNFYDISSLTIISGQLNTTAGSLLILEGVTFPVAQGSTALWANGVDEQNPTAAYLVDYVSWGAASQAYESIAVAAGKWGTGEYVNSSLPISRSNNYGTWGASEWSSALNLEEMNLAQFVEIGPVPFSDHIDFKFEQGHTFTELAIYNLLGKLILHQKIMQSTASITLPTSELVEGIYFVQVQTSDGLKLIKKLVKR